MRNVSKHLLIGVLVPVFLLATAFLIPEPYSHPFIYIGISPAKLMPFLENHDFMRSLSKLILGRDTANYGSSIGIIFLIIFWFMLSFILSRTVEKIAFALIVIGTLVWGYGDIPFNT